MDNPMQLRFRDLTSVLQSPFNRDKPLRVLIHGWTEGATSDIKVETSRELLTLYDFNILFVDWSEGANTITYLQARNRVQPVGEFLASYLDFLHENAFIDFNRVGITGFSLGGEHSRILDLRRCFSTLILSQLTWLVSLESWCVVDESTRSSDSTPPVRSSVSTLQLNV